MHYLLSATAPKAFSTNDLLQEVKITAWMLPLPRFLGYTFKRRLVKSKYGNFFNLFTPAASRSASQKFKDSIRKIRRNNKIASLYKMAELMNPVIWGWANYFWKFCSREARKVLDYVNLSLVKWVTRKYKTIPKHFLCWVCKRCKKEYISRQLLVLIRR